MGPRTFNLWIKCIHNQTRLTHTVVKGKRLEGNSWQMYTTHHWKPRRSARTTWRESDSCTRKDSKKIMRHNESSKFDKLPLHWEDKGITLKRITSGLNLQLFTHRFTGQTQHSSEVPRFQSIMQMSTTLQPRLNALCLTLCHSKAYHVPEVAGYPVDIWPNAAD